jgi:hypothetical protein
MKGNDKAAAHKRPEGWAECSMAPTIGGTKEAELNIPLDREGRV